MHFVKGVSVDNWSRANSRLAHQGEIKPMKILPTLKHHKIHKQRKGTLFKRLVALALEH